MLFACSVWGNVYMFGNEFLVRGCYGSWVFSSLKMDIYIYSGSGAWLKGDEGGMAFGGALILPLQGLDM